MKTTQILIAGFGGQGILFAGKFLAYKGLFLHSSRPIFSPANFEKRKIPCKERRH